MFSKVRICLIMAIVILLICSILATPIGAQEKLKIGFAHVNMNCPYYVAMQRTAEEVAKEENIDLIWYNSEDDELKQVRQVMSMIGQGIDGLLINPVTPEGEKKVIKQCVEEGIPVVAIDRHFMVTT